jgi:hypothetical protein
VLSCSHIFHKECLGSFEKHTQGKKCPICRRENYEKMNFFEGSKIFIERSATLIQSLIRQYITRCAFFDHLLDKKYEPHSKEFSMKLKDFRLARVTDKFTKHVNSKNYVYKKMIAGELDRVKLRHAELMYDYEKNVENIMRARNAKLQVIIDELMV